MIVIIVRIMLTWFGGGSFGRPMEVLSRITDPYLNLFRRSGRTQFSGIDFSPVIAILVLSIVGSSLNTIAAFGHITVGIILAIALSAVAQAAGFFLVLLLILAAVRLIGLFANANTAGRFWLVLDHIVEPIVYRFTRFFLRTTNLAYRNSLLIFGGSCLVVLIGGKIVVNLLIRLLIGLPF